MTAVATLRGTYRLEKARIVIFFARKAAGEAINTLIKIKSGTGKEMPYHLSLADADMDDTARRGQRGDTLRENQQIDAIFAKQDLRRLALIAVHQNGLKSPGIGC